MGNSDRSTGLGKSVEADLSLGAGNSVESDPSTEVELGGSTGPGSSIELDGCCWAPDGGANTATTSASTCCRSRVILGASSPVFRTPCANSGAGTLRSRVTKATPTLMSAPPMRATEAAGTNLTGGRMKKSHELTTQQRKLPSRHLEGNSNPAPSQSGPNSQGEGESTVRRVELFRRPPHYHALTRAARAPGKNGAMPTPAGPKPPSSAGTGFFAARIHSPAASRP
jgi:hypothetical protein